MTRVSIATLGCKVNQFESEALMASLEQKGYRLLSSEEGAEITVINTCTVTQRADFQSRQMVRRAFRSNPKSLIIVTGCYPQIDAEASGTVYTGHALAHLLQAGSNAKVSVLNNLYAHQKGRLPRVGKTPA